MAMARQDSNPLVAALPPQTDYLTYLTIVEYNLNKDQLLTLHSVLQDTKLTTNIGWDLVQLLLPLLPESELCLQDIAFFGNPRETVLKVAELLDGLGRQRKDSSGSIVGEETKDEDGEDDQLSVGSTEYQPTDLLSLQFQSLLHMLCILHPRIQTKKPSRFLTTSLKAVIIAFMNLHNVPGPYNLTNRLESGMRAILMLIKSLSGSKRPHLPPRRSQSAIPSVSLRDAAPDPEGHRESIASEEEELRKQILQSFFMHVLAAYVHSLDSIDLVDTPLAWSTRHYERKNVVPGKRKFVQAHEVEAKLDRAEANISQLLVRMPLDIIALLITRRLWQKVICMYPGASCCDVHSTRLTPKRITNPSSRYQIFQR